jgi:hypothetical protein
MVTRTDTPARVVAVIFAAAVIAVMSFSLWPSTHNGSELLGMLLSLPWGLVVILALDTINPELIMALGPPLMAMCGLLNAFLLYNALKSRHH